MAYSVDGFTMGVMVRGGPTAPTVPPTRPTVTGDTMRNMMVLVVVFGIGGYTLYPVIMTAVMVIMGVVETLGG